MTVIKPFKAVYYNEEKVGDLLKVVCPPYDIISPEEQNQYHNLHAFNFIRVLLGQQKPTDDRYNNRYTRAKKTFDEWLSNGVLKEDAKPGIYYYRQEYTVCGQKYNRIGFIALMRLQDEKEAVRIFPHENTHSQAKEDRLRLWRNIKGNCSPIFVCFSDHEKKIEKIFNQKISRAKPFVDIVDYEKVRHALWRLDDVDLINEIKDCMESQPLFIADGHHRYEVALDYRKSVLAKKKRLSGQEPCNFIMTYFTNLDSRDLLIFPIHRIIKKAHHKIDFLQEFFRIDRIKTKEELVVLLAKAGQNENAFGMYTKDGIKLLRLKNRLLIDKYINEGSREFKSLDASILKYFIIDRLGVNSDDIIYSKSVDEAIAMVNDGQADMSFIMNPVKVQQLKAIALNGERMPPKTTYFYPKVLSGLTVYRLNS